MAKAFTPKTVENMKPNPEKRLEVPDPGLSGLYLVVQPSGAKTWAVRYRFEGKPVKLTVGTWPKMELAAARAAASAALASVERGNDPAAEKKAEKAAASVVIDPAFADRDKIKTLIGQFDKRHLSTLKSGVQVLDFLNRYVVKVWAERDIKTITKRDVIDLLDGIMDSGKATTANRVKAHLSSFFNWSVGRDIIAVSPMTGIKAPAKEVTRDRALSDDEIRLFVQACEKVGEPWGPFGKVLLLTGQRLREVAQMTDAELDGKVWHLSAARTKNKRAHDVPLSDAVQAILKGKERIAGKAGYIFTTTGSTPVSGFSKARSAIAAEMVKLANKDLPVGADPVAIPDWTFHDLRRTAATGMARSGIAMRVTEAVLNHISGTASGIVSVYQRHDYADEKKQALEAWARLVAEVVEGKADNVVRLEARA